LFDDEATDVLRFFTKLKCSLMPYLFAQAVSAHQTGVPMMRPMVLEFQNDPVCAFLDKQYMLGENLLVAPVFNDSGHTSTYLPYAYKNEVFDEKNNEYTNYCHGIWTHWLTNKQVDSSGEYIEIKYDYFNLPLWVRPNTIIATGNNNSTIDYDYEDFPTLHVFCLDKAKTTIFGRNGKECFSINLEMVAFRNKINLVVKGKTKGFKLLFRNIFKMHTESNFPCRKNELGFEIDIPAGCKSTEIYID
jgi:alpha-D-xyloside xylohydrolase